MIFFYKNKLKLPTNVRITTKTNIVKKKKDYLLIEATLQNAEVSSDAAAGSTGNIFHRCWQESNKEWYKDILHDGRRCYPRGELAGECVGMSKYNADGS